MNPFLDPCSYERLWCFHSPVPNAPFVFRSVSFCLHANVDLSLCGCETFREISVEKLSLDDSPIRGDHKRETDGHTPVRQTEKEENRDIGEVCYQGFNFLSFNSFFFKQFKVKKKKRQRNTLWTLKAEQDQIFYHGALSLVLHFVSSHRCFGMFFVPCLFPNVLPKDHLAVIESLSPQDLIPESPVRTPSVSRYKHTETKRWVHLLLYWSFFLLHFWWAGISKVDVLSFVFV